VVTRVCHPSYYAKQKIGCPDIKSDPISKIANAKRIGGVAEVVELETLNSIPIFAPSQKN
jgi:hypothetical protein